MTGIRLRVGEQGRMVIPVELRKALGLEVGTEMVASIEGDRLVLETRKAALASLKHLFTQVPSDVSLASELIVERRAEAQSRHAIAITADRSWANVPNIQIQVIR